MARRGFTLIELLIVVVIIGILAAIAIPKFGATKEKSWLATMKSDLRNVVTAQESYFYDYNTYFSGTIPDAAFAYSPSTNVSVVLSGVSPVGWGATASHASFAKQCAIFYGAAPPPSPATSEGQVACN